MGAVVPYRIQLPQPVYDPLSLGVSILVNIGWAGTISAGLATAVGIGAIAAGVLGATLLTSALAPQQQQQAKPSDRQTTVRQALGPRLRFYGRNKVGGSMFFFDTAAGSLYVGITLNWGEISEVVEWWLNDAEVTWDNVTGDVTAPNQYLVDGDTRPIAHLLVKAGTDVQTVQSRLDSAFATVGAAHRLRGTANVLAIFDSVDSELISQVYPNYVPQVRAVADMSLVTSVRTGARIYSDNAGDVIYDYLTAVDGAGFGYGAGWAVDDVDTASFQSFADLSDDAVPLKAGGTVARYRLWGGYALNEEMRNVLPRLLRAVDADLYLTGEGKVGIWGGQWVEPTLTLDDALGHIISATFQRGQGSLAAFNELTITYLEPELDFSEAEAEPWVDTDNIALRDQVLSEQLDVLFAPHHSQARRVGKIHSRKKNPRWQGSIVTNFFGLNAIGERVIRVKFSPLGIDETFEVRGLRFADNFAGVEIKVASLDASAYAWDATTEEGTAPSVPADTSDTVVTGPVTSVSATPSTGKATLGWTLPASSNVAGARTYRNTANDFTSASRIYTDYGAPSAVQSREDIVPAGTYYYWIVAINGSGLEATEVATGLVTVT